MALRRLSVLASMVPAAGIAIALASCSSITPLGPAAGPARGAVQATPVGIVYKLGSPIILQVMRGQQPTGTGGCPAGLVQVSLPPGAAPMPCFRPVGAPVTITTAAVSAVSTDRLAGSPALYEFVVGVQPGQVAAVTALIKQAYDSKDALGVSVEGKLWEAPQVDSPFPGQQLQIALQSRTQALQLHGLLVLTG